MKRRSDVPSRTQMKERLERNETVLRDATCDLEKRVSDVETVCHARDNLELNGTVEAADAVCRHVDRAHDGAESLFTRVNETVEERKSASADYAKENDDRAISVESDVQKIRDSTAKVDAGELRNELEKAAEESQRDAHYLVEIADRARASIHESSRQQADYTNRVRAARKG